MACEGYLPVPMINRDAKRPAGDYESDMCSLMILNPNLIPIPAYPPPTKLTISTSSPSLIDRRVVGGLLDDGQVAFDRDAAGVDLERFEQGATAERP